MEYNVIITKQLVVLIHVGREYSVYRHSTCGEYRGTIDINGDEIVLQNGVRVRYSHGFLCVDSTPFEEERIPVKDISDISEIVKNP